MCSSLCHRNHVTFTIPDIPSDTKKVMNGNKFKENYKQ